MNTKRFTKILIFLAHALVGWALCGAIIGIGRAVTSMQTTLIVHALGAPVIFGLISRVYFRRFNYTTPLQTGLLFMLFAIAMDFFVVAMFIEKSFEMFTSLLGTWIPFGLIFLSTYLTGTYVLRGRQVEQAGAFAK
ncbi:MAG: hypothetical protein AB1894_25590 [Chloroflexota bacterium]